MTYRNFMQKQRMFMNATTISLVVTNLLLSYVVRTALLYLLRCIHSAFPFTTAST